MRPVRRVGAVGLAIVTLAAVASCDRGPQEAPPPPPDRVETLGGGTLRFGLAGPVTSLDPYRRPIDTATLQVLRTLYDPLLVMDENSALRPNLAESVEPVDDTFRTFEIRIRPGVTFSDGTPLDAEVVAANLRAATESPDLAVLLAPVEAIQVGSTRGDGQERAAGAGEGEALTVRVEMDRPWASFPYQLAGPLGMMRHDELGTGPFVLVAHDAAQVSVARRDGYWRDDQPLLDGVEFPIVPDPSVRATMLLSGELDLAAFTEPEQMARLQRDPRGLVISTDPSDETGEWVLVLNTRRAPFDERIAREAAAYAVDREALATRVFAGQYRPAKGPYSEGSRFFGDARWPILDIGHANDLASQVAAATGEVLTFQLLVGPDQRSTALARVLASQFATVGIRAEVVVADDVAALDRALTDGEFDAAALVLFDGAHPDDDAHLLRMDPDRPELWRNPSGYRSDSLDEALEVARTTDEVTPQAEAYQLVQAELATQLPYLFLVYGQGLLVSRPGVQGLFTWSTVDGHPGVDQFRLTVSLNEVWLDDP